MAVGQHEGRGMWQVHDPEDKVNFCCPSAGLLPFPCLELEPISQLQVGCASWGSEASPCTVTVGLGRCSSPFRERGQQAPLPRGGAGLGRC